MIAPARFLAIALLAAVTLLPGAAAWSAELLMFERKGCVHCARWLAQVGPVYPRTDVAKRAPLRRVDLGEERPPEGVKSPVRFTPTFVLMDQGREVGRIVGFIDDATFWGLLANLMARLDEQPAKPLD